MEAVTAGQMEELDRLMIGLGIGIPIMMENAGLAVARLADAERLSKRKKVSVLAGKGNNGGDGLCAARHLLNWGFKVRIILASDKAELNENALKQLIMLENINADIVYCRKKPDFDNCDLIIDALLGYNIKGNPRSNFAAIINKANRSGKRILAVDLPSGLDPDTGKPHKPCIKAHATVTLALPKKGLLEKAAKPYVGKLFAAYLGVPDIVYEKMGIRKPFTGSEMIVEVK